MTEHDDHDRRGKVIALIGGFIVFATLAGTIATAIVVFPGEQTVTCTQEVPQ